jgi:hypothetical protein
VTFQIGGKMFNPWKLELENRRLREALAYYMARNASLESRIAIMNKRVKEALRA